MSAINNMEDKTILLLNTLRDFYKTPEHTDKLYDILNRKNGISLRTLEWFIINYSKTNNVTYTTSHGKKFSVHVAYKASLDGYSKKFFDPFCRTRRIEFDTEKYGKITTTVAQLNFIKWCIVNNIIDYIKTENITNHARKEA